MKIRTRIVSLILVLGVAMATTVRAQGDGSLRGTVTDDQGGALPGVTVTATSPEMLSPSVAVTDGVGQYRLINLPPGTYTLVAELEGFSVFRREGILMRAGANFQVDFSMAIGTLAETITVSGASPMLEVTRPSNVLNIDGAFQRQLVLVENKAWVGFLEMTPGVMSRPQNDSSGRQNYFAAATDQNDNVASIEGMNAATYNDTTINRTGLSTEAIEDVQIKTGGVDAASPMGQGLVINMVGRSGGNQFHGSAGHTMQPFDWNNNNIPGGVPSQRSISQSDFSFGGPIARDRLWFFGAARYQNNKTVPGRSDLQITRLRALFPGKESDESTFSGLQPFVKATTKLGNNHTLQGTYQGDRLMLHVLTATSLTAYEVSAMGGSVYGARLTSVWSPSVTTTLLVAHNNKQGNTRESYEGRLQPGPRTTYFQTSTQQAGTRVGTTNLASEGSTTAQGCSGCMLFDTASVPQIRGDLTWFKDGWAGSHEFQTGFLALPSIRFDRTTVHLNNGLIEESRVAVNPNALSAGTVPFFRRYVEGDLEVKDIDAQHKDLGLYVQDTWRVGSRLTTTAGLRVDFVRRNDLRNNFQIQSSTEVGPRLGMSYLLTQDAQNVFRATYARVHENMQGGRHAVGLHMAENVSDFREEYDLNVDGTFETIFRIPAVPGTLANKFGPNFQQSQIDEFIFGYRRQFPGQVALDVAHTYRLLTDRYQKVDINGFYPDGPNQPFGGFGRVDPNKGIMHQLQNATWNDSRYSALQITLSKNLTRGFQALVALHRQWNWMTGTWNPTDPARFIEPDKFATNRQLDKAREGTFDTYTTSNSAMTMWSPYAYRMSATWNAPFGVLLSSSFAIIAGSWSGPIMEQLAANDPRVTQFGPPTVVSSTGVRQSNPLATRLRMVYATRGEGQVMQDAVRQLSLKAGKRINLGASRELEVALNILNVINEGRAQNWAGGNSQTFSANYLQGTLFQPSRAYQLDMMFRF